MDGRATAERLERRVATCRFAPREARSEFVVGQEPEEPEERGDELEEGAQRGSAWVTEIRSTV